MSATLRELVVARVARVQELHIPVETHYIKTGIGSYRNRGGWYYGISKFLNPKRVAASQRNFEKRAPFRILDALRALAISFPNSDDEAVQEKIIANLCRWLELEPMGTIEALLGNDAQKFNEEELVTSAILRHQLFVLKRAGIVKELPGDFWQLVD